MSDFPFCALITTVGDPFLVASLLLPLLSVHEDPAVVRSEASNHNCIPDVPLGLKSPTSVPCLLFPEESFKSSASKCHRPCKFSERTNIEGSRTPKLRLTVLPAELEAIAR